MKTIMGTCNFCGQTRYVDLPDNIPEETEMEEACYQTTIECNCKDGSDWRATQLIIEKCSDNIETLFRESYPDIADILQEAKGIIYTGDIKRITCVTPEGGIAAMYKKGESIELKYTTKKETTLSADW